MAAPGVGSHNWVVVGEAELRAKLRMLPPTIQKKVLAPSMRKGARIIQKTAQNFSPKLSGLMRRSLTVKALKNRDGRFGSEVLFRNVDQLVKVSKAGKRAFYPASVEYGRKTPGGGHVKGRHFIRHAYDTTERAVLSLITAEAKQQMAMLESQLLAGSMKRK